MAKGPLMMGLLDASSVILLVLSAAYLVSGFALVGDLGLNHLMSPAFALRVHNLLHYVFIPALAVHCGIGGYITLKRRRVIR